MATITNETTVVTEREAMRDVANKIAQWMKETMGGTVDIDIIVATAYAAFTERLPVALQRPENYMRFALYLTVAYIDTVAGITDNVV